MEFIDYVRNRYSVRAYKEKKPEEYQLEYVLECARLAPSAVNRQPWHLIIADSIEAREKLCACYHRDWLKQAPMIIVVCVDRDEAWTRQCDGKNHGDIDAAIITEHICLAATEVGLGTCWVCNFDYNAVREALNLPEYLSPVVMIPIGYPADTSSDSGTRRKDIAQIVEWR